MSPDNLEELLIDLGFSKRRKVSNSNDINIMICCPFHGESNPSCGISAAKEIGACFSCGKSFTLTYFVAYVKEISMLRARDYLEEKFNVAKREVQTIHHLRRFEDVVLMGNQNIVLPHFKLAPYKSGKVAHQYLLDRGFRKETLREFMIGWDEEKKRVTIPIFWNKVDLAGFIGRAVLDEDDPLYHSVYGNSDKYLVYNFVRSNLFFPMQKFVLLDSTAILVEGTLDAMWMHYLGFKNTLSLMGSKISDKQVNMLSKLGVRKVIFMLDNDTAGIDGKIKAFKKMKRDFYCFEVVYPDTINDAQGLSFNTINSLINHSVPCGQKKLKKII